MEALIAAHDDVRLRGRPERAVERVERLLREPRVRSQPATQQPLEFAIPILAEAGRPARARALLERLERALTPQAAARREAELHVLRGTIALAEGRTPEAIDELTQGSRGECRACALPLLARAYERAGAPDSAVAVLQRYLATPDFSRTYVDAAYLAEIHQRLGALHEAQGRRREAAASYQRLVALWRNAEPELQPVVREARAHAARLLAGDDGPRVPVLPAGAR
jgi:tetratricopeptide (TPR) repeat protein